MQQYQSLEQLELKSSCVTIGAFDGVHLGHNKVIHSMMSIAKTHLLPSVVITFYPHPAVVLGKTTHPQYLQDLDEKTRQIADMGVDYLIILPFTKSFAQTDAEVFIKQVIHQLHMQFLVTGNDFALGKNQQGNLATLEKLGQIYQFQLQQIPEVDDEGHRISSTFIRKLISDGEIHKANQLLGRYYHMRGKVKDGDHRGRKFGFPTANLISNLERQMPKYGVYATFIKWQKQILPAITNIGMRPTFKSDPQEITIETYILDFQDTIYSEMIDLYFVEFIRPEMKFSSSDLLYQQIETDIKTAREILAHAKEKTNLFT